MRLTVHQSGDAPGTYLRDETVLSAHAYEEVVLFGDGLRLLGYWGERYKDKAMGYEDWTFRDVTDQGRPAIVVALTMEGA